ncbi:hypothetical protein ACP4OV_020670 [Aristida adscensionis]
MSEQGKSSSSYGDADTGADAAPTATTGGGGAVVRWAPHGRALTACLIAANVALVALVYLYFWRVFFRRRGTSSAPDGDAGGGDDDEEDASSLASAYASPARARDRQREHERLVASLPTFVVARSGGDGAGGQREECAVCIAELRDGDEGRALPRCGHRFHAACVDAWLRRHTTCPLCRGGVAVAAAAAAAEGAGPKGGGGVRDTTAAAAEDDVDAPGV